MYAPHAAPSNHHAAEASHNLRKADGIVHYMYIQGVEHTVPQLLANENHPHACPHLESVAMFDWYVLM